MTLQAFRFDPIELPPAAQALRREVRAFLADNRPQLGEVAQRTRNSGELLLLGQAVDSCQVFRFLRG